MSQRGGGRGPVLRLVVRERVLRDTKVTFTLFNIGEGAYRWCFQGGHPQLGQPRVAELSYVFVAAQPSPSPNAGRFDAIGFRR
jgi:hypothetical protein